MHTSDDAKITRLHPREPTIFLGVVLGQCDEFLDKTCRLPTSIRDARWGPEYRTRRTLSPAPVAPSISSTITRTGFELPIPAPDSNTGRILSSTTVPERASLTCDEGVSCLSCFLESDHEPRVDLKNLVPRLFRNDMGQRCLP